jgi:hypothetical protein
MNQQLESDLREALSLKTSCIPTEANERLCEIDYHARSSRALPRITVASLAGVAATTGIVASVVILGSSQPAFAGWSPSPTPASALQTSIADSACQAQLSAAPALPGTAAVSGWSEVTTDVRGPFTLVIYQSGGVDATCLTGPSITIVSRSSESRGSTAVSGSESGSGTTGARVGSSIMVGGTGLGSIKHVTVAHMDSTSQGPYTLVEGQVDAGVTAVTLLRSDGDHVQASTGHGWFVAWWPGQLNATSAEITTASGVTTQTLNTMPSLPPARSGSCDANPRTTSATVVCTGSGTGGGIDGPSTATQGREGGTASATNAG